MNLPRPLLNRAAAVAALLVSLALSPTRASIDVSPADGIPDIWALRYSAGALDPNADSDGDGQKNSAEAAAGTNPMQVGSAIKITSVTVDGTGVHLTFPTVQGKRYQLQTATTLTNPTWTDLGTPLAPDGSGSLTATNNAVGATSLFYRVKVQDIDSDGDGVSDWEEMQIGFDPYNSHSNGLSGPNDLTAITTALSATNVVSVTSSGVPITEPPAPGVSTELGTLTISRTGNLNAITVNYTVSGGATPGSDYVALSGSVTLGLGVNSATLTVTPLWDAVLESRESVIVSITPSAAYTVGASKAAAVLIDDMTTANGTGVTARFWNNTSATIPVFTNTSGSINVGSATPVLTRVDTQINNTWGTASPGVGVNTDYFVSRFTGEVLPEFSQIYTFQGEVERGGRLWVNGQLMFSSWSNTPAAGTYSGTIELTAGHRVSIVFEHMARSGTATAILSWQSASQPMQVIPQNRLFPSSPPHITSDLQMLLLKGGPVATYQIVATNDPTSFSAANLPTGWTINGATGLISINPTEKGTWQIPITATNAQGSDSAILVVEIIATDSLITRDVWTGISGNLVSSIPLTTTPNSTSTLGSLEVAQSAPDTDNFGERIRGYITVPVTGTYKFWLTADDAAELWISDDDEPVNILKRAELTAPVGFRNWAAGAVTQLIYLEAASRYYVEVRHKEGTGTDHVSVGWLKPGDAGTLASEVVPGYALSQYVAPAIVPGESTLYAANLTAQAGAVTGGYGSGTLRVSADESVATLKFTFANLTANPPSGRHIHLGNHGGSIVFDIDTATANADGSYTWIITDVGAFTKQTILDEIHGGTAYLNIHTALYPAGEIKGFLSLQAASQTFTAPPAPPSWTDNHTDPNAASRFLAQATFGPKSTADPVQSDLNTANPNSVLNVGFEAWIDNQFLIPATHHYDVVYANRNLTNPNIGPFYSDLTHNAWWQNSISGADQLRQRVAFALSEILVVSTAGPLEDNAPAVSSFYDKLLDDAFGNFRTILQDVTLTPAMGIYLDMRRNDKPSLATGAHPNENYAREIMQLFSIGLNRMHPDGSLILNSKGELVPTYGQDEIIGMAHVFTGWDFHQAQVNPFPTDFAGVGDYLNPMTQIPAHHFTGPKRILNRVVLPGLPTLPSLAGNPVLDPYATHTSTQINTPEYQALPAQELAASHDGLFNHPNCAPFICRQLIQRLVTSTPSLGYVYRVVSKFNDNGSGVRGDMKAVIKAILLDYEARSPAVLTQQGHGKQREPLLRVTATARAFMPPPPVGGTYTQDGGVISVTTSPTQHRLASNDYVSLVFAGASPRSTDGIYRLSGTFPPSTFTFNVRTMDVIRSNYTQSGTTVTVATGNNGGTAHGLTTGDSVYMRFRDGAGKPADGVFMTTVTDGSHFTITVPTTATIGMQNCDVAFVRGEYVQSGANTVTLICDTIHGLTSGNIAITFTGAIGQASFPANGTYPFTVIDDTHISISVPDTGYRVGRFNIGADAPTLNRTGTASTAYSNFKFAYNTDGELAQTPLRSPTVFNYFLPDFQFPGVTANAGLITPEFQLTSETNVMRQANFLYYGLIYNPSGNTGGVSSFRYGEGNVAMDFSPWMGNKPGGSTPWTNNENLLALIDQFNTLLVAGQLTTTGTNNYASNPRVIVNARQAIYDFVTHKNGSNVYDNITYTDAAPSSAQKRDRIVAIVHLIVTSPDFTILK